MNQEQTVLYPKKLMLFNVHGKRILDVEVGQFKVKSFAKQGPNAYLILYEDGTFNVLEGYSAVITGEYKNQKKIPQILKPQHKIL